MRNGARCTLLSTALGLIGFLGASSASAAVTIGSDLTSAPSTTSSVSTWVQRAIPGRLAAAPIDGVIVRWRVRLGSVTDAQNLKARVVRGIGAASTSVASSQPEEVPAGQGLYTFGARIPIRVGDNIGLDTPETATMMRPVAGADTDRFVPLLADGETRAPGAQFANELTMNADIEPDCDGDGFGDETQDVHVSPGGSCPPADQALTLGADKHKVKKGGRVLLTGDLQATGAEAECEAVQTVELQRRKPTRAQFTTFDQVSTFATGYFSLKERATRTFEYRARVAESAACQGVVSNVEKIKVKRKKSLASARATAHATPDASCPAPREFTSSIAGFVNVAQPFTAQGTGRLTEAQVDVIKFGSDTPGDWVLRITEVDGSGSPTHGVLAETTVPFSAIDIGSSTITGSFSDAPTVVAGGQYALVISRPAGNVLRFGTRSGDDCPGRIFTSTPPNPFLPIGASPGSDLVFAVFVLENDPPETSIVSGPKQQTRKRSVRFEFTSDEPGSTFRCTVDGQEAVPCAPPYAVRVEEGKHTFSVQAVDQAGNVGPPATDNWKLKKKKK
jgi:hypothetical protein